MKPGALLISILALLALAAPYAVEHGPLVQDRQRVHHPPQLPDGSGEPLHLLGTDALGRDVLSRTLFASRYTLSTAAAGVLLTLGLGTGLGALAGFLGGGWDRLLMRSAELFLALPALYLILGFRNLFPDTLAPWESAFIVVLSLAAVGWAGTARLVRGQVLSIRERDYVAASLAAGASRSRLLLSHVLPALRPFLLLQLGLLLPYFLTGEVTLSFLGLGLQEPDPSLGNMLSGALLRASFLERHWWTWLPPAATITAAVLGANLFLEGLRERYLSELGSEPLRVPRADRAVRASRSWLSSGWGSKHWRHRAS